MGLMTLIEVYKRTPTSLTSNPVYAEIEERREFLAQMQRLGRGKEYSARIEAEISQVKRWLSPYLTMLPGRKLDSYRLLIERSVLS